MQRALAEAEEEVARQRREMGAEFQAQAQQLELKYRQQAEDAQQVCYLVPCCGWGGPGLLVRLHEPLPQTGRCAG